MGNSTLRVGKDTNDGTWWLINDTDNNEELLCKELYGFNTGTFQELASGHNGLQSETVFL